MGSKTTLKAWYVKRLPTVLGGRIPEQSPRPDEEDEIEVEVHLLSGRNSLIQIRMDQLLGGCEKS